MVNSNLILRTKNAIKLRTRSSFSWVYLLILIFVFLWLFFWAIMPLIVAYFYIMGVFYLFEFTFSLYFSFFEDLESDWDLFIIKNAEPKQISRFTTRDFLIKVINLDNSDLNLRITRKIGQDKPGITFRESVLGALHPFYHFEADEFEAGDPFFDDYYQCSGSLLTFHALFDQVKREIVIDLNGVILFHKNHIRISREKLSKIPFHQDIANSIKEILNISPIEDESDLLKRATSNIAKEPFCVMMKATGASIKFKANDLETILAKWIQNHGDIAENREILEICQIDQPGQLDLIKLFVKNRTLDKPTILEIVKISTHKGYLYDDCLMTSITDIMLCQTFGDFLSVLRNGLFPESNRGNIILKYLEKYQDSISDQQLIEVYRIRQPNQRQLLEVFFLDVEKSLQLRSDALLILWQEGLLEDKLLNIALNDTPYVVDTALMIASKHQIKLPPGRLLSFLEEPEQISAERQAALISLLKRQWHPEGLAFVEASLSAKRQALRLDCVELLSARGDHLSALHRALEVSEDKEERREIKAAMAAIRARMEGELGKMSISEEGGGLSVVAEGTGLSLIQED